MPFFVMFIFGSIILGAGAMLAPALPTAGPRIGLAGALTLAFITTGAIFYAASFGWNTLVIDYMVFAALVGIFLSGTMSAGMYREESKGGTRTYVGWPGPRELAFFLLVAIIYAAPALTLPVPLDTDGQGIGYLALTLRQSGSLTTLAPFHPDVQWLYSPGFPALIAYLSERLNAGIYTIEFAMGSVLAFVFLWLAYDLGNELDPGREKGTRRVGVAFAIATLLGTGLFTTHMDSQFTAQLALVFALAFITFAFRFYHEGRRADFVGAVLTLGALPLSQPNMAVVVALGYIPWLILVWFSKPRPALREYLPRWLMLALGIPLVTFVGLLPWLRQIAPLIGSDVKAPFEIAISNLAQLTIYQGPLVLIAIPGIWLAIRRRNVLDVYMLIWLILIIDFSSLGIIRGILGGALEPILKYTDPQRIAWHGAIIPYIYFGGTAFVWLLERGRNQARTEHWLRMLSLPMMNGVALIVVLGIGFPQQLLDFTKTTPFAMYGAFSSRADIQAMQWLTLNSPTDTLILNHPGPHEGDWTPIIAQRNTVYFRPQPFFLNTEKVEAQQNALRAFWRDPANLSNETLLKQYGVDFVIVPQIFGDPDAMTQMWRWRMPIPEAASYKTVPNPPPPFLELVYDSDGARVYQVK